MPKDDARWERWCDDFDEVEREVFALFHTRWMWRAIISLMANGVPDKQYTVVQNYFVRTYVATICTAIRREADLDSRTTSLARCLHSLIECPHFATRTRYVALARAAHPDADPGIDAEMAKGFDRFAPDGGEYLDPALIEQAITDLAVKAQPIKQYTNKVLAHRERAPGDLEKLTPSFETINAALDGLGEIFRQFFSLRHPGTHLGTLTPVPDLAFVSMFKVPWYSQGWTAPSTRDQPATK